MCERLANPADLQGLRGSWQLGRAEGKAQVRAARVTQFASGAVISFRPEAQLRARCDMLRMCAGVVPQQPPISHGPAPAIPWDNVFGITTFELG